MNVVQYELPLMTKSTPQTSPTSRRDRKRKATADHVAATAFGLFEEQGYDAVTMEQVAAAADVAKGTLYKYFPVKEALLAHQFQQEIAVGMAALWPELQRKTSFAAQMKYLLRASAVWNTARRFYLPHYVRYQFATLNFDGKSAGSAHTPSGARQIFEKLCRAGQEKGQVRADLSATQMAAMLECMCLGAITIWLKQPDADLEHEFDALLAFALDGIKPLKPQIRSRKR